MFGHQGRGQSSAGFRGQDFNAELHLSLRDAAQTHKQILTVNGKQVRITIPVLGGDKVVDTLDGKVKLKIKPETQNGTKVRLKGKGFPVYKKEGQFGDLIVTYSVKIPTNLTEAQKELFRQLQSMN